MKRDLTVAKRPRIAGDGRPRGADDRPPSTDLLRRLLPPSDGRRYRQLTLAADSRGALSLTLQEMGAGVEAAWGGDGQERELRIPAQAVVRLAIALLTDRLAGCGDGLDQLTAYCEDHDIHHTVADWT